jgi:hypothetical protein
MPSSWTVRAIKSTMPLNLLRPPPPTMAKLLSWVCNKSFARSIGATIVCTTLPITAPAIRSRWKFVNQSYDLYDDADEMMMMRMIVRLSSFLGHLHLLCSFYQTPRTPTLKSLSLSLKVSHGIVSETMLNGGKKIVCSACFVGC